MKNYFRGSLLNTAIFIISICFIITVCDNNPNSPGNPGDTTNNPTIWDNKPWVDPATQTTPLTGGTQLLSYAIFVNLPNSPYHYSTWDFSQGSGSTNKFTWYGANKGGGGAFKAEWTDYFLARIGFFWGNGGPYTQYKNIYADYNYIRTANSTSSNGGFIGVYGWSRNPSAANNIEKLIEYYIVDDWFYDIQAGPSQIYQTYNSITYGEELGSFTVDGAIYKIYTTERHNEPSIDGDKTFIQIFSVRQGRRTYGTISVTEHFKAWSRYLELGNMFEATFKVETFGGGNGHLDLTYLYLSQETNRRNIPAGTTPVDYIPGGNGGDVTYDLGLYTWTNNNHNSIRGWDLDQNIRGKIADGSIKYFVIGLNAASVSTANGLNGIGMIFNADGLWGNHEKAFPWFYVEGTKTEYNTAWNGWISYIDLTGAYGAGVVDSVVYLQYDLREHPDYNTFKTAMSSATWGQFGLYVHEAWDSKEWHPVSTAFFKE